MSYQTDKDGILKQYKAHEYSMWCPHCGEEFGVESEINTEREAQHQADMQRVNEELNKYRFAEPQHIPQYGREPVVICLSEADIEALKAELNK